MTRKEWQGYNRLRTMLKRPLIRESKVIENNANWLIAHLYKPNKEVGARHDGTFKNESINWGDLHAFVEKRGKGHWDISIEEAAPECVEFPAYIEKWLNDWGWHNVRVSCEW